MAFYTDLFIDQGTSYSAVIPVTTTNGLPLNLTEYAGAGHIRRNYNSSTFITFNVEVVDAEKGLIFISLSPQQTAQLKGGSYVYDIVVYTADKADIKRVIEGQIIINPGSTKI